MKKIINGYIARDGDDLIFSDQPMKQDGYIDKGGIVKLMKRKRRYHSIKNKKEN